MKKYFYFIFFLTFTSISSWINAQETELVYRYKVDLNNLENDQIHVQLIVENIPKNQELIFSMPKIVPGIYGAMDFGQYITDFKVTALDGEKLDFEKIDINSWKIDPTSTNFTLNYSVNDVWEEFDFELIPGFYRSAASSFNKDAIIFNNNCVFGYFKGYKKSHFQINIKKPEYLYAATSLSKTKENDLTITFETNNYHELVDQPILFSRPDTTTIHLKNIEVEIACYSSSGKQISKDISEYIKPLLENQTSYLGGKLPINKYTFLIFHNLNPDENSWLGDGLEHSNSTLILLYMPLNMDVIKQNVYGIASHEFFHTLMPLGIHSHEIAEYDYNHPEMSQHLWLYEGMTEYFTIHMPIKNKLQSINEFKSVLEQKIMGMNQFDNTISFTELSVNAMAMQDQYYNVYMKGALINLCLDIKLRELSKGKYGVQNLVFELLDTYGPHRSFDDDELFDEITKICGYKEIRSFFNKYVEGSEPLPLKELLLKVGMEIDLEKSTINVIESLTSDQIELRKYWINN